MTVINSKKSEKKGANIFLYGSVLSVNLLSFCAGSGYSWTSPVLPKLSSNNTSVNPLSTATTTEEESWIASLTNVGAIIGSIIVGPIAEKLGRKKTLITFSIFFLVPHLLYAFGKHVDVFLAARFVLGLGTGCVFTVLPAYVGEISEAYNRGLLSGVMGTVVGMGQLFNYVVGPFVSIQVLSFLHLIPVVLFYALVGIFVPESPYYYISTNNARRAEDSLNKLRRKSAVDIKQELMSITKSVQADKDNKGKLKDLFQSKAVVRGLIVSCGIMVFQQFSGICAVAGYMQIIFEASGSTIPSHLSVIVIGLIQVIVIASTTVLVDVLGRRTLFISSTTGTFISLTSLGTYFYLKDNEYDTENIFWLPLLSMIVYIIAYDLGLGSLPWTIMGELFSTNVKSLASSITSFVCLTLSFFITKFFLYLSINLGMSGTFWVFAGFCGAGVVFSIYVVPETKGKSLSEIQQLLSG